MIYWLCHIIFWTLQNIEPNFKLSLQNIDPLPPKMGYNILWLQYAEAPSYFQFPFERGSKCNGCKILNPPLFPFPFVKGGLKYYGNNLLNSPPISNSSWRGNSKYYIYGDNILNPPPIFPSHCMGRWFKIFHGHKILNHLSNWNGK